MFADLHIHTNYSDGTMTPYEIAAKAKEKGIGVISVCDHNTVDAYPELSCACAENGIKLICGMEIDCEFDGAGQHILAYGANLENPELQELLRYNLDLMERLSIDLIGKMAEDYPALSTKEYATYRRCPRYGGWKGIDYLRSKGFSANFPECMKYYKEYNIKPYKPFPDGKTVCDTIHRAGGAAVLAHPGDRIENNKEILLKTFARLKEAGVDGIECYYPSHSEKITGLSVEFCRKNNMLITAGSDCHGEFAKVVGGVTYEIGVIKVDTGILNLNGLLSL